MFVVQTPAFRVKASVHVPPLSPPPIKRPESLLRGSVGHLHLYARPGSASPRSRAWALRPAKALLTPLMSLKCLAWAPASPTPTPKMGWERTEQGSCQLSSAGPWEGGHHVTQTHPGAQPGTHLGSPRPASPSPAPQGPSQNQSIHTPAR